MSLIYVLREGENTYRIFALTKKLHPVIFYTVADESTPTLQEA